jgi:hypothetical protein
MDVQEQGFASFALQLPQAIGQGLMIRAVNLLDAALEFISVDRSAP